MNYDILLKSESLTSRVKALFFWSFFCLVFTFTSCDMKNHIATQYKAERVFDRCIRAYQKIMINPTVASLENYVEAKREFSMFLDRYENYSTNDTVADLCKRSYFFLAQLAILQADHATAVSWYERSLNIFQDDSRFKSEVNLALANTYQQLLEPRLAALSYEKALAEKKFDELLISYPQLVAVPLYIARLEDLSDTNGDVSLTYADVEDYYDSLIQKESDSELAFWAMIQLANSFVDQKRWDSCIDLLEKIVKANPKHKKTHDILLFLGRIHSEVKRDHIAAKSYYEKVLETSDVPRLQASAHLGLGALLFEQQRDEEARKKMRWLIDNFPRESRVGVMAQHSIAYSFEKEKRWDRAMVEYRWLMDTYPLTKEGLYAPLHVANHFNSIGEKDMASTMYSAASQRYLGLIAKYPLSQLAATAHEYLALTYAYNEQWEFALNIAEQLQKDYKAFPQTAMGSHLLLAQLHEKNGEIEMALGFYDNFVDKFPGHPLAKQVSEKVRELEQRVN